MVKKGKKSKSKRVTLRQKHKVLHKVKELESKNEALQELEAKKQALQELEAKKEARKERARKRKLELLEDEDIANLASATSVQGSEFAEKDAAKENAPLAVAKSHDHSERSFYKELVEVIEASDVILEVLDARDPLGTRCIDMEKMVRKADPSKRIVQLLNKIDLVPKEAVEKWLTDSQQDSC